MVTAGRELASSAGRVSPSESAPRGAAGQRAKKPHQANQLRRRIAGEAVEQRGRHLSQVKQRHEGSHGGRPERPRKGLEPPFAPAPERAPTEAKFLRQTPLALWGHPLLHRGDQRHRRAKPHLAAEKAQRRRRRPRAAAVRCTAETETQTVFVIQSSRSTTPLAGEPRRMQRATTLGTAGVPGSGSKIAVELKQLLVKSGVVQQGLIQASHSLSVTLGKMAKTGRNEPCPCGSGKKYKQCCLAKDEAAARAARPAQPAAPPARRPSLASYFQVSDDADQLTKASNGVAELIRGGNLDAAEQAAHDLLTRFPEVHDGYDRLGMVCEARGDHRQAADYYRKVIAFIHDHPDDYDPEFEDVYRKLVDRLDPPTGDTPA